MTLHELLFRLFSLFRLILLSITDTGTVLVWAYILAQNWDVYAPGFRILSHNEEYVESETEFDLNPKDDTADGSQKDSIDPVRFQCSKYVEESVLRDRSVRSILRQPLLH